MGLFIKGNNTLCTFRLQNTLYCYSCQDSTNQRLITTKTSSTVLESGILSWQFVKSTNSTIRYSVQASYYYSLFYYRFTAMDSKQISMSIVSCSIIL